jgi:transposase
VSKKRRIYTTEFKRNAVELSDTSGKTVAQIERDLDIPQGLLYKWRRKYRENGSQAFLGKGQLTPEQERIRELERELAVVQQERDILKKAIAIFSETQK